MKKYISNGFLTFADILSVSRFMWIMYWALKHHFLIYISVRWSIYCSGLFDKSLNLLHSYYLAHHQVEGMTSIYWNIYLSPNHKNIKKIAVFTLETDIYTVCFQRCEFETNTHFKYWCWWRRDLKFLSDIITVQPWKVLLRNYPRIQLRVLKLNQSHPRIWLSGCEVSMLRVFNRVRG